MLTRKQLQDMAKRTARVLKLHSPSASGMLSEKEQLRQHQERMKSPDEAVAKITKDHGLDGLHNYLTSMKRLGKKHGVDVGLGK